MDHACQHLAELVRINDTLTWSLDYRDSFVSAVSIVRDVVGADLAPCFMLSESDRFRAWVSRYLNVRVHSETGESPLARYSTVKRRDPQPDLVRSAFLWSAHRRVSRTAAISFEGNEYEVDAALTGRTVELRYRPEDLFAIEVWFGGRHVGWAEPRRIARHVHRQAPPPPPEPAPPTPTGIDYLGQVLADHEAETAVPIAYRTVPGTPPEGEPF